MPEVTYGERALKMLPVAVLAAGLIGTGYVTLERQAALAEDVADNAEDIEDLDEILDKLRENDIRTEGQLKLEVQRLNSNIANQSAKIDQLLRLLTDD